MKKPKSFAFEFPLTNFDTKPISHVADLHIEAVVYALADGSLHRDPVDGSVTVDLNEVRYQNHDILPFVKVAATEMIEEIIEAARQHGGARFEIIHEAKKAAL